MLNSLKFKFLRLKLPQTSSVIYLSFSFYLSKMISLILPESPHFWSHKTSITELHTAFAGLYLHIHWPNVDNQITLIIMFLHKTCLSCTAGIIKIWFLQKKIGLKFCLNFILKQSWKALNFSVWYLQTSFKCIYTHLGYFDKYSVSYSARMSCKCPSVFVHARKNLQSLVRNAIQLYMIVGYHSPHQHFETHALLY